MENFKSILIFMKFVLFLCFMTTLQVIAVDGYTQNATVNIHMKDTQVEKILKEIEKQSEYRFFYDAKSIQLNDVADVSWNSTKVSDALSELFGQKGIAYRLIDKQIVLFPVATTTELSVQQGIKVSGKVTDESGIPMPGVNILIKGSAIGVVTDINGNYNITVPNEKSILVFSFIGYISYEMEVAAQTTIDMQMAEDTREIEEVVVVGYGTQKKVNMTGAVDMVTDEVLQNRAMPNLSQGLQGVIPNLNLVMNDGKPIQSPSYNIRGTTSIGQKGNALVLIDGVEGDPSLLNPNDVASVSVLKDAASASIYGARGVFGVVLITTKNPSKDKVNVTYSANYSTKRQTRFPETVSDSYTFSKMFSEAFMAWNDYAQFPQNINKTVKFSQSYLDELERRSSNPSLPKVEIDQNGEYVYYDNVDYFKELYKDRFGAMDQNISISGGSDKSGFYITGRYYGYNGIFRHNTDDYQLYNIRAKGFIQLTDWLRIENNMDYSNRFYHNPLNVGEGGGIWRNIADEGHPMAPLVNPDGNYSYSAAYTVGDLMYGRNGFDMQTRVYRNTTGFVTEFFDKKFRVKGDFTIQHKDYNEKRVRVQVPYSTKPDEVKYVGTGTNDIREAKNSTEYIATNLYAEYETVLSQNHYIKGLAGFNYEQSTYQNLRTQRNELISPDARDINLAFGQNIDPRGGWDKWAILSGFFRLNYVYKEKYLLEVNGRYDGSSKFPENQRYAFFPSVSLGWRITQEDFWTVDPKIITNIKIRASYGSLGNGNVASYTYQEKFNIEKSGRILNGIRPQRTTQPGVLPAGLTWETATTSDIGLDMAFLSNRLTFGGDIYQRITKDMYTKGPTLPAVFGTDVPKGNYADLKTSGWELIIGWRDQFKLASKDFTYDVRFTMSDYQTEITKYNNDEMRIDDYYIGKKEGEIWGYINDGYFTKDNITGAPTQPLTKASNTNTIMPGDIKFKDLDGNNTINKGNDRVGDSGDRRVIGNSTPRYTYGLSLGADWNNFFFSIFFQGVGKQDWWPGAEADMFWGQYNRPYNKIPLSHIGNIWSEDNPDAYFPRYRGYTARNSDGALGVAQSKYLQNVAYIRLKNFQFGYNLPQQWVNKMRMSSARVYISGENLWAWSPLYKHIKELDVENILGSDEVVSGDEAKPGEPGGSGNGNNYPMIRTLTFGMVISF